MVQQQPQTLEPLQPLHHIIMQKDMGLIDELWQRIQAMAQSAGLTKDLLSKLKSGEIDMERVFITDEGWRLMPAPQAEMPEPIAVTPKETNNNKPVKEVANAKATS